MNRYVLVVGVLWRCTAADDQSDTSHTLNDAIRPGANGVYSGGKGVLIRQINDGFTGDPAKKVVPATFITDDIHAPSVAYPAGNPFCPNFGNSGYNTFKRCDDNPWVNSVVVAVVASKMNIIFKDFDNIQDGSWGWGVFYATDSNSADQRCEWVTQSNGWDCPNYWLDSKGTPKYDPSRHGAGGYDWGNPAAGLGGGGAGCHHSPGTHTIDQFDAANGENIVADNTCQCNYKLKGNNDWADWVDAWIKRGVAKPESSWMGWFSGGINKAPSWAVDLAACWMNNPRDMINLQNRIWERRHDWSNQMMPSTVWDESKPESMRVYWGWNEVPVQARDVNNAANWDCIAIKLPADICKDRAAGGDDSLKCLENSAKQDLDTQLAWYKNKGYLKPGFNDKSNHPGSQVVLLREYLKSKDVWQRWFYCESFKISNNYQVVFWNNQECYVDYANQPIPPTPPPPTPPPAPPVAPCPSPVGLFRLKSNDKKCLDMEGQNPQKGGSVRLWDCTPGAKNQQWKWCDDHRIATSINDKMCLDVPGGSPTQPADHLWIWDCLSTGNDGQIWYWDSNQYTVYPAKDNQMCIGAKGDPSVNGALVNLQSCANNPLQWILGSQEGANSTLFDEFEFVAV